MDRIVYGDAVVALLTPAMEGLFRYWNEKRGDHPFLLRQLFDPMEVPRHLPGIQLVEVVEGDEPVSRSDLGIEEIAFRYRVVGAKEVDIRRRNPTGIPLEDGFFGNSLDRCRQDYYHVYRNWEPVIDLEEVATEAGYPVQDYSLFLPLGRSRDLVDQVLVYSHQSPVA
ncbi:MAG: hypothetical protein NXI16_10435 [Alphaproteobacteria bacterium]|nr:hypothetical protein [Alphaproteobacteria bacterium]